MLNSSDIRKQFPILNQTVYGKPLIYLDNAATTQKPQSVTDTIVKYYTEQNSNIHRGVHYLSEEASEKYENVRETVRSFINAASVTEIVFTFGTTDSINLVADSFGANSISEGDEIIVSEMEHHSNIVPWQIICEKRGALLKVIPLTKEGTLDMKQFKKMVTDKTKLVSITYVSNVLGVVNDVEDIISFSHSHDIPVFVDAAQAVQHMAIDVQKLDCDFLAFSGHKMYAGTGVGILYGKEKLLESMPPYRSGGGMIKNVSFEQTTYAELPFKFESGTSNISGVISMGKAIDFINSVGLDKIEVHEMALQKYAKKKLHGIHGVNLYSEKASQCGALSFNIEGAHYYDVGLILDKLGIAVRTGMHCAEPLMNHLQVSGVVRASFALYNTAEEIDQLVEGVTRAKKMLSSN